MVSRAVIVGLHLPFAPFADGLTGYVSFVSENFEAHDFFLLNSAAFGQVAQCGAPPGSTGISFPFSVRIQ
jgi:hypothetical protein